ncbi:DMT family transporter [Desulfospira joergensenii]|uniref:DMT family transporter n=1 Tax=Desulfospira joergensenii TaxID=53329 RepID=UPI0003B7954F|nr:DMT family transporter [Desulfospira joergensenii]
MLGSFFAINAALFWAVAIILYKKSQGSFSPITLNIYKSIVALVLISVTMLLFNIPFFPDKPLKYWMMLSLSGFLGITLADIFFFIALDRLGAGLLAIVECLYLPSVLLFSFIFLGESLSPWGIAGSLLVFSAVIMGSLTKRKVAEETSSLSKETLWGLIAGILSILFLALGIVIVKEVLEQTDVFWATLVRVWAGVLSLGIIVLCHPGRGRYLAELKFSRAWLTALPASVAGNYIALVFWVAGMKYTTASRAAILNQMSTIFIFILAALFLKEKITLNRALAIGLAMTGACLTILG